jgi:hypothetical protein
MSKVKQKKTSQADIPNLDAKILKHQLSEP